MSGLLIDDISMRFDLPGGGSVQALKNVSLDIKAGELMSVLGPSGCGKTTLLRMIAGFETPTSGQILIDGADVSDTPPMMRSPSATRLRRTAAASSRTPMSQTPSPSGAGS